jgi:hypothetical protein
MAFNARYPGRCADCDEWFDVGSLVRYEEGELIHDEHIEAKVKRPEKSPCSHCWTVHAGECI